MLNPIRMWSINPINCMNSIHCLNCMFRQTFPYSTKPSEVCLQNIRKLQELFKVRPFFAKEIVSKNKELVQFNTSKLVENFTRCTEAGISNETLMKNPNILTRADISLKLNLLEDFNYNINVTAPLMLLDIDKLDRPRSRQQIKEKIKCVSNLLKITESDVCKILSKRTFLISLNLHHLEKSVQILNDYGIPKEEILKDLWVLKYSVNTIESRLQTAKENNIQPIKTWMVRAQHLIFENHIRRQSDNKLILGDSSLIEYFSERLECSQTVARYIISKHTALQNKSLKKLNGMIDFLLGYGFNRIQICRTPKILLHSVETIKKRLKEVENEGTKLDTLSVLTKSKKQFDQFLESIKPTKKRAKQK